MGLFDDLLGEAKPQGIPVTRYSIPKSALGGKQGDEMPDPDTARGVGISENELGPAVVAVNPSVYPYGTIFRNTQTNEVFLAGDKHGNKNPNVVDLYSTPSAYKKESGTMPLVPIDRIATNKIPKSYSGVSELLAKYGKVPEGEGAYASLGKNSSGGLFDDLLSDNNKEGQAPAQQQQQAPQSGGLFDDLLGSTSEQAQTNPDAAFLTAPSPTLEQTGKPINLPAIQKPNVFEQALTQYPKLQDANPVGLISTNTPDGANKLESWPSGEEGTKERPRPMALPKGQLGVQILSPDVTADDVAADIVSHQLVKTDPVLKTTYDQFASTITPAQQDFLRGDYDHAVEKEGEKRPFDQWMQIVGIPSAFRGYAFNQYDQKGQKEFGYTDQQKQLLGGVKPYLQGQQQSQPPQPSQLTSALSGAAEGTIGLLSGLGAAGLALPVAGAVGLPTAGIGAVPVELGAFFAGSKVGELGAKELEKRLGLEEQIKASQQAYPKTSSISGLLPMLPMAIESGLGYATTGLTKGLGALATKAGIGAGVGAGIFEPIRYGVDVAAQKLGLTNQKAEPITGKSLLEQAAFGLALGGMEGGKKPPIIPETKLNPSADPAVNQKEAAITANADAQAPLPEAPVPINIPAKEAPTTDVRALRMQQMLYDEGSPEHTKIQADIDALNKPAETPAEAQPAPIKLTGFGKGDLEAGSRLVDSIEKETEENQLDPRERIVNRNAAIDVEDSGGIARIHSIRAFERGVGAGRDALNLIIRLADQEEVPLVLDPKRFTSEGLTNQQLKDWYSRNGFVEQKDGSMRREPKQPTEEKPNAVQEQTTGEVGVRNAPAVGEGVGEKNSQVPTKEGEAKPQEVVLTEEQQAEKVLLDKIDAEAGNPKPVKQKAPEVNPYSEIISRYESGEENAITTPEELVKEVEKLAKRKGNKYLKDAVDNFREVVDSGKADVEPEVEKLLSQVKLVARSYKAPKVEKMPTTKRKTLKDKAQDVLGDAVNGLSYVLENKILDPVTYKKMVKSGIVPKGGGEYDFFYNAKLPKKVRDLIFSRDGSPIDVIASEMGKTPDELLGEIQEAYIAKEKIDEQAKAKDREEKAIEEEFKRMEELRKTDPETYAGKVEDEVKKYLIRNSSREGGFIEFPDFIKDAAIRVGDAVRKGVTSFKDWSSQMISRLGEGVSDFLKDIWAGVRDNWNKDIGGGLDTGGRSLERAAEEAKFAPKPPNEQEAFAKKVADAMLEGKHEPITEVELSNLMAQKFPGITQSEVTAAFDSLSGKPKPPTPYAGVAAQPSGEAPFGISRAAQEGMVQSGELTHVSPSAEPVAQQDRLAKAGQALDAGADPEQVIRDLKAANIPDKIAQGMVHANQLKNKASEALKKYGYNSPEYKAAKQAHQDYQDRLKEAGSSQAGSALNIVGAGAKLNEARLTEAYDFANAFHDQTKGQDMTLSQIDKASKLAERNKKAEEETKKAQDELGNIRDDGFSDVDVKTPETLEEARDQVGDLSDAAGKKTKEEIDRINNELEQTKKDLNELKQSGLKTVEELRSKYEKEKADLQKQLEESQKVDPLVKRIMDKVSQSIDGQYEQAIKRIRQRKKEGRLFTGVDPSSLPDNIIVGAYHFKNGARDFAKWSKKVIETLGDAIEPHLQKLWENSKNKYNQEIDKTGLAGKQKVKTSARQPKKNPVEKMTPAEKTADNLRKRIAQYEKKIKDIEEGRVTTPKDVEKVTNEEIQGLEKDLADKKKQIAEARLKAKQSEMFPDGKKITGKLNIEQAKTLWESAKKFYIPRMTEDAFYDEHRLIADMADDFGLSPDQVRDAFAMPKGAKRSAGNLFLEQQKRMQVLNNSRRWLLDQSASMIGKLLGKAAEQAFRLSVFGHGTAFITTHALPLWATNPVLGTKAFLRAMRYTFTGRNGRKQWIIDNNSIVNHPDYEMAIKGGAEVNPFKYGTEKPQRSNPDSLLAKALDPITGGRGFDALHWLRMQYFSKEWRKLSPAMQTEEMAKVIGEAANTATGYSESKIGSHPIVRLALFAPKLYKSQFKWLIGDPLKMTSTFAKMAIGKDVSAPDAWQAKHEFVNKAKFIGMYASALAMNQLILSAAGSNAQINFTDPKKHDWLAFKTNDGSFNPLHPFISIGRLTAKITHDLFSDYAPAILGKKTPLEKSPGNNIKLALHDISDYAFNKLSPIARQAAVLVNQRDFAGNTVPWSSVAPLRGKEKLTWSQYMAEMYLPIPFSEASTQKEWTSKGAAEKLGSALIFGVPYETKEDEERWAKSHAAKTHGSSEGTGPFGLKKSGTKPFGLKGSSTKPFGLK